MGRHSIPDPEESSGGPPEGASDATESFDQPLVPPDDYPRARDAEYEGARIPAGYGEDHSSSPAVAGIRAGGRPANPTTTTTTSPITQIGLPRG